MKLLACGMVICFQYTYFIGKLSQNTQEFKKKNFSDLLSNQLVTLEMQTFIELSDVD